ncbi:MAG TPA: diaminopimelate decarboxylase [Burkholderiales bacterium]|nr:diaminopimelate decarboxylase [Burkholderiales bacterium]
MNPFHYRNGVLHLEEISLESAAAEFGTPCYLYSKSALVSSFRSYADAFSCRDHLVCYAVKANSNIALLNLFAKLGGGFDIVSLGELERVLKAGGDPSKIVFSGVGKREDEMAAALEAGILCFNIESESELERMERVAGRTGKIAKISLRVNPDVDAKTHPYISTGLKQNKFGIPYHDALRLYRKANAMEHLSVAGIDCHIGSQLTEIPPFVEALEKILFLVDELGREGIFISHIDVGGGLGIRYKDENPPEIADYAKALLEKLEGRPQRLLLEPGRYLVGNAGLLLTRIEYLKHGEEKNFAIVDCAMNDLMRPALYDAYHEIVTVKEDNGATDIFEIVGPVCETGDFLGHERKLVAKEGALLAILSAGAYGMSMSSNYNSRPRAPEILVDGKTCRLVRERETISGLMALEKIPE